MKEMLRAIVIAGIGLGLLGGCAENETTTEEPTVANDATEGDATETNPDEDGTPPVEVTYLTCAGTLSCAIENCEDVPDDDFSCLAPCVDGSSEEAKSGFDELLSGCMVSNCFSGQCDDDADEGCLDDCMFSECGPELFACVDPLTFGEGTCSDGMDCFETCGPDDDEDDDE